MEENAEAAKTHGNRTQVRGNRFGRSSPRRWFIAQKSPRWNRMISQSPRNPQKVSCPSTMFELLSGSLTACCAHVGNEGSWSLRRLSTASTAPRFPNVKKQFHRWGVNSVLSILLQIRVANLVDIFLGPRKWEGNRKDNRIKKNTTNPNET